jgi:hypothetical protein
MKKKFKKLVLNKSTLLKLEKQTIYGGVIRSQTEVVTSCPKCTDRSQEKN